MDTYSFIKSFKNWFQIFSAFTVAILLLSTTFAVITVYMEDDKEVVSTLQNYYPNWDPTLSAPGTLSVDYDSPPDLIIELNNLKANLTYLLLVNHIDVENDGNVFIIRPIMANDSIYLPLKSNSERIEVVLVVIPNQTGMVVAFPVTIQQFELVDVYQNFED